MIQRVRISIRGAVQGVGFRPFIYRLANDLKIKGFINNTRRGVLIEGEAEKDILEKFLLKIQAQKPLHAHISDFKYSFIEPAGYSSFKIITSEKDGEITAFIMPDIALCPDCLREMNDPTDRRYRYPFINCTNCGPRFSIVESIPYDRKNTSMKKFEMCPDCRREYENPFDRRYHAQPIACPVCGPHIELWDSEGNIISEGDDALRDFANFIKCGFIGALKGIGGFQLIVDALNDEAIIRLRLKKNRAEKPLAVMFPDMNSINHYCYVSGLESEILLSPESPIVLLKNKSNPLKSNSIRSTDNGYRTTDLPPLSRHIAPYNPYVGAMLPYSPLHHLLMDELKIPVIATSGNISEEPMCIDEYEALDRLSGIADFFLVHDRPVVRHVDDSIVRVVNGSLMMLRRARGYAPLPVGIESVYEPPVKKYKTIIALGGQLKNSISLKIGPDIFVSQHIGDMTSEKSQKAFENIVTDFKELYHIEPDVIVRDNHPDYYTSLYSEKMNSSIDGLQVIHNGKRTSNNEQQPHPRPFPEGEGRLQTTNNEQLITISGVQHHIAHVASCMLDNNIRGRALGISWDGTGYGLDHTIWGGEFFIVDHKTCIHAATFRKFPLPGGEMAIREPRRSAFGLLYAAFGDEIMNKCSHYIENHFIESEAKLLVQMMRNNINSPLTSSVGRLFDAVASLLDLRHTVSFEGQAAMLLEFTADENEIRSYGFETIKEDKTIIDFQPFIEGILADINSGLPASIISAKFHNTLINIIINLAKQFGEEKVVLSGGCFQNVFLLEKTVNKLTAEGFKPFFHHNVPANDGGIALGQIAAYDWKVS